MIINNKRFRKLGGEVALPLLFLVISFVITYFYFYKGYFKVGFDDVVHFQVFESIKQAFANHRLPPIVNFIGFSSDGEAFNGMYPWLTSLIFVIPSLLIKNTLIAIYFSISILLFLTIFNFYLLVLNFTNKRILLFCVSILYGFNQYNLINIYNRGALGEALGFSFLPLTFLGIIKIWQKEYKEGSVVLALGMSLIINSHILTTLICCIYLLTFEVVRFLSKKVSIGEIKSILFSIVMTIVASFYTLSNIIKLSVSNDLTAPWRDIQTLSWNQFIAGTTQASLNFQAYNFNFGIFILLIMVYMVINILKPSNKNDWKKWVAVSFFTFLLTFSWVPYKYIGMSKSIFGTIQFTSRLLNFVVIFLLIGFVIFIEESNRAYNKTALMICSSLILLFTVFTEINYINDSKISQNITNENINSYIYGGNYAENDYSIKDRKNHNWSVIYRAKIYPIKESMSQFYNGVCFSVYSPQKEVQYIRFLTYEGINYNVVLNNHRVFPNYRLGILRVPLNKGINKLSITVNALISEYISFIISIIGTFLLIITFAVNELKSRDLSKTV